jgi:L-threonylcarbamoyladenylate synthase
MERILLDAQTISLAATSSAVHLKNGGVVLFPTDTLYGLGADAFSNGAVDKVYVIKGRNEGKPIHALVSDLEMAARFCDITEEVRALAERLPKGKVTFICKKKLGLEMGICRGIETFGFRIPDNDFCIAMIDAFGGPITATSANVAGMQPLRSVADILEQLGAAAEGIDLVVDGGELPVSQPSTVISFVETPPRILREGAIAAALVEAALLNRGD